MKRQSDNNLLVVVVALVVEVARNIENELDRSIEAEDLVTCCCGGSGRCRGCRGSWVGLIRQQQTKDKTNNRPNHEKSDGSSRNPTARSTKKSPRKDEENQ